VSKRHRRASRAAWLAAAALACAAPGARAGELRAGLGVARLPTAVDEPMGGYGGIGTRRAEGVLDPPEARALVLEQGDLRVALVSLDVVIARPNLRELALAETTDLGIDVFALVATHTHSGPGGYLPGWLEARLTAGDYDPEMPGRLAHAAADAVKSAVTDLAPARLSSRTAPLALARNRRYADGPTDTQLAVLRIDFADGRTPIVLFNYGVHATVLSPRNHLLSGDWPGAAREELAANGFRALFVQGPLGDQEPAIDLGYWSDDAQERDAMADFGKKMAQAVLVEARAATPGADPAELAAVERWVDTPPAQFRTFCSLWWFSPLVGSTLADFVSKRVPFQAIRAGNAELATVPAEPGAAVGVELRKRIARERIPFVVAHANDWLGYVVDLETYERGGYEACLDLLGPESAHWIVENAGQTVEQLGRGHAEAAR
jgi:neutral ceramidase